MQPITLSDILILPGILIFFGCFVYGVAFGNGVRDHALPRYRWVGTGLIVVAVLVGVDYLWQMYQPGLGAFYRASLGGSRKLIAAHYACFVFPLILLGVFFGLEKWFQRYRRDMA